MTAESLGQSIVRKSWEALLEHLEQGINYLEQTLAPVKTGESKRLSNADVRLVSYLYLANRLATDQLFDLARSVTDDDPTIEKFDRLLIGIIN